MLKFKLLSIFYTRQFLLLAILVLLALFAGKSPVRATIENSYHKVIAPKNVLTPDGRQVIFWHDYGSFALYRVRQDAWGNMPQEVQAQTTLANDMDFLFFGNTTIDSKQLGTVKPNSKAPYTGKALHLIQFVGPIKDEWLDSVKATGTELVHYIANNGYLVWTGESGRQELHALAQEGEFIQFSAPYLPSFKIGPTLDQQQDRLLNDDELITVTIQMFRHKGKAESEAVISNLIVDELSPWEPILNYQNLIGTVFRKDIPAISRLADVVWVGERLPRELTDEVQGRILAGSLNPSGTKPGGPGYLSWFSFLELSTDPDDYPIVDITDDGIGNGLAASAGGDVTLRELGDPQKPSRIEYIANCTAEPTGAGPDGHGHINLSIAGGYDGRPGNPYRDEDDFQRGLGINPYGRFAGTRVFDENFNLSGCGGSEQSLIRETYNRGARIVSNSWGCSRCAGQYDESSQAYDAGVRDADNLSPGNQEFFILFSAGNNGPEANTIGSPGNGKNMITVGASESVRPTWIDGCGLGPEDADNVQDIAVFSSRGPAPGGRVKPDVIAPGTHIQGTAATTPDYNGEGVCDKYRPTNQQVFAASSGTSHSTPAIAGMASLVHTYIRQQEEIETPSPALIKGYIIAHSTYLSGVSAGGNLPSQSQGFGLPDMTAAFADTARVLVDQGQGPLFTKSGEIWSKTLSVADPTKPVRIVLAYTDQPGAIGTQPQVNDLNLSVQANGKTFLGNHMNGQWSVPGGTADKVNNVEAVFLPLVSDTALEISVTAFNIAGDGVPAVGDETDQDFALVCSNCIIQEDFTITISPPSNSICLPGSANYTVSLGSIYNFSNSVALQVSGTPNGITAEFDANPLIPPAQSLLTFSAGQEVMPGSYSVIVSGQSSTRQHSSILELNIFSETPEGPELLNPPNGALNQELDLVLTWAEVDQAAIYEVEIATDSAFEQIVGGAIGLTGNTFKPDDLKSGFLYYWRVRAINGCGSSDFSSAFLFTTKVLPGSCPVGVIPNVLYSTDFEGAISGWKSSGTNDTWTLSSSRSHSANTSYYAQNLALISDQMLVSPQIKLPPFEGPLTLQFWNYQEIESNEQINDVCFDGAILEISTDDGLTWKKLGGTPGDNSVLTTNPYDGFVDSAHSNPLAGTAAWCGDPQDWLNSVVRLDGFAEKTIRFRFRLGTDESIGHDGWYIDDVLVQSCPVTLTKAYFSAAFSP